MCKVKLEEEVIDDKVERIAILKGVERVKFTRLLKNRAEEDLKNNNNNDNNNNDNNNNIKVETVDELGRVLSRCEVEEWRTKAEGILEDKKYMSNYGQLVKLFV